METQSIPWREKVQLIVRFLRGSIHYFVVALLCACLGMVFNALTPQVIRLTVDSILCAEEPSLPAFLQPLLPLLQAQKLHALWLAAAAVLLLAGLQNVSATLYEAADLDGASKVKQFFSITLPMVSPTLFVVMIMRLMSSLKVFDLIYMMVDDAIPAGAKLC